VNPRDPLQAELQPDIDTIASALFDLSRMFLRRQDRFLPHGAVLTEAGGLRLVAAAPDRAEDVLAPAEALALLHDDLRRHAHALRVRAVGVAEDVAIDLEGQRSTRAIKVSFEHRRGLAVAIYLPFRRRLFRGHVMGAPFTRRATPQIRAWAHDDG
jgi:hypothetical protein